jgi:hypothetical protein
LTLGYIKKGGVLDYLSWARDDWAWGMDLGLVGFVLFVGWVVEIT